MSFDAFLYSEGHAKEIKGETQDTIYKSKSAIEILSFELGAENTINIGSISAGGGAGKASFKEFTITKKTDQSSAFFFEHCVTGKHFDDITIDLRRTTGKPAEKGMANVFMQFQFKMVMVQDVSWSGSDGDDICEETLILQFGAIQVKYQPQKPNGEHVITEDFTRKWSRVKNEASLDVE